jgi:hypothetical protein
VSGPPLLVLGVRRSGTTLFRVMLDRHPEVAIPDESYFVPQLAERHRGPVDVERFVEDLRRIPTLREWGLSAGDVRVRLVEGMTPGAAIAAVFETYAAQRGKSRWGDKTPLYMQYLPLLERLFPDALFLHLVRDGRDAAVSFRQMPAGIVTESWGRPRSFADFAAQWRTEVEAARALGRRVGPKRYLELRYEDLVARPEEELGGVCRFAGLEYDAAMLGYAGEVDVSAKPHQQSLTRPPTPGLRDWRRELTGEQAAAFESVAGDLLAELGYETAPEPRRTLGGRLRTVRYRALTAAWRGAGSALRRSPLWERRHPPVL